MSREHIETLRHFVDKATKWNDAAGEYANDIGVYDALDALEARAEAGVTDGWIVWAKKRNGGKRHLVMTDRGLLPYKYDDAALALQMRQHGWYEWEMVHATTDSSEWEYMTPLVLLDAAALTGGASDGR